MRFSVLFRIFAVSFMLCMLLSMSAMNVSAEEDNIEIEDQSGWQGIYFDGVKVGHSSWSLEKATAGKKEYYKILLTEERKKEVRGKEVINTYKYEAKYSLGLQILELEYEQKVSGSISTVKAKVKNGNVDMKVYFGKEQMPSRKLEIKELTSWAYCSPMVWAWRNLPLDVPQKYHHILEIACTMKSYTLKGEERKETFQGEEVGVVSWADEEGTFNVVTDGAGKFLYSVSKGKKSGETKIIAEEEAVALSDMSYDQYIAKKKKSNTSKKPKKGSKKSGDGPFENALDPVDDDAAEANGGEYFKLKVGEDGEYFTIRAAEGWMCGVTNSKPPNFLVVNKEDQSVMMRLIAGPASGSEADELIEGVFSSTEKQEGIAKLKYVNDEEISIFEQGESEFAYAKLSFISSNTKMVAYVLAMPGEKLDLIIISSIAASDVESYEEDILSMLGSARFE